MPERIKIALVEDEAEYRNEIAAMLRSEHFEVLSAPTASRLQMVTAGTNVDLYLIDLGLPDASGLDVVQKIRATSNAGIIIVSERDSELERVVGLEIGADDYVCKPYSERELLARIKSVLRRRMVVEVTEPHLEAVQSEVKIFEFDGWSLNPATRRLIAPDGTDVKTTKAEFDLLETFLRHRGNVLSRDQLITQMKGRDWAGYDRAIDGLVSRLRTILRKKKSETEYIRTCHGVGYSFT